MEKSVQILMIYTKLHNSLNTLFLVRLNFLKI